MSEYKNLEPMVEMYLYETTQLVDRLEQIIMGCEEQGGVCQDIGEIFRLMHTIKGNSMMMMYDDIANVAHAIEDLFDFLKGAQSEIKDYADIITLVLDTVDFFKAELMVIEQGDRPRNSSSELTDHIKQYLESLKFTYVKGELPQPEQRSPDPQRFYIGPVQGAPDEPGGAELLYYRVHIKFEPLCELENVRAFSVVHGLKSFAESMAYFPPDIAENEATQVTVAENGFDLYFSSRQDYDELERFFDGVAFIEGLEIELIEVDTYREQQMLYLALAQSEQAQVTAVPDFAKESEVEAKAVAEAEKAAQLKESAVDAGEDPAKSAFKKGEKGMISVGVDKVNQLVDLIGELVVSESMVTRNPEIGVLNLDSFEKAARRHRFIIRELQDAVMSIRMVPLDLTFQKMQRLVRDMSKKTGKDIQFDVIGAHTEVDKKVIESLGDPLMHIIRNAIDHGMEMPDERRRANKIPKGLLTLEAKQEGGNVYIRVKDDGKGLDKQAILKKAKDQNLLEKAEGDYTEREIFNFIFQPGFSTKEAVTEFSGRGVGMDVVVRNIEEVGGSVTVDSQPGFGSTFIIKIPLTLAIIEGMLVRVGESVFSLPITAIQETFMVDKQQLLVDNNGNELVNIRDVCYPVLRLHDHFCIDTAVKAVEDGIVIMLQTDNNKVLLFVDTIIGEQQLVVKNIPRYLKKVAGISGCALLGDGRIALILDPASMIE